MRKTIGLVTFFFAMNIVFLSEIASSGPAAACEIPQKLSLNKRLDLPVGCSLKSLGLSEEKYSFIPKTIQPTDAETSKRFVGIPKRGLILEVDPGGQVFSIQQEKAWKEKSEELLGFDELMIREFKVDEFKKKN